MAADFGLGKVEDSNWHNVKEFSVKENDRTLLAINFAKSFISQEVTELCIDAVKGEVLTINRVVVVIDKSGILLVGFGRINGKGKFYQDCIPLDVSQHILLKEFRRKLSIYQYYPVNLQMNCHFLLSLSDRKIEKLERDSNNDEASYVLASINEVSWGERICSVSGALFVGR
ncbi:MULTISPECIES: hypothetical protein [unclassified Archaeoglobus]|jgi:hypothetical protein|uniref:hypothetical protein n=1 Tax=unclassified Archaeoglobus TaxID=2643606 RepID=UPI0025C084E1|nr:MULTISPECIES: hypothetical protein [unclassified Archaeoglobus]